MCAASAHHRAVSAHRRAEVRSLSGDKRQAGARHDGGGESRQKSAIGRVAPNRVDAQNETQANRANEH